MLNAVGIYAPKEIDIDAIVGHFQATLGFDRLDPQPFDSEFAIGKQSNGSIVRLWLVRAPEQHIEDARGWDWIDESTRAELPGKKVFTMEFNDFEVAKKVVSDLIAMTCERGNLVIDNDLGVLLKGSDVRLCLERDPSWRWDRETFPEIEGCPHVE